MSASGLMLIRRRKARTRFVYDIPRRSSVISQWTPLPHFRAWATQPNQARVFSTEAYASASVPRLLAHCLTPALTRAVSAQVDIESKT